jgi:hypothetical protein
MSSLACKNVKIQDSNGNVVSTISWNGNNVAFDKPVLATAPTASAGTNTTQLATTAFAYGALSTGGNGYQILPSGLIIQWGKYAAANANTLYTINYPINFPNNVFIALSNPDNNGTAVSASQCNAKSTSQLELISNAANVTVYWAAIGN